ncbi:uncharacterized protein PV09_00609 [Verruconis gallopava]|uniref:Major facilitator superfamily (MFS) profile domain-containing protein n=1 Tax=Verruconis gallopava TaxID=253628 RepID=A0A0D2BBF8_9PEZI|nr:uncharacterized protein PV09_00609 [Verruconis gallopava]KIW08654.1 hypothetical protein PV09_00609 [Verruconis gallopava]
MKISSILLYPYWKIKRPWDDHVKQFEYLDWESQRKLAIRQIDKDGFGYWTVFVAGAGFLTDAYDIFAVNAILPMLSVVYWGGNMPKDQELLINLAVLVGTFISQFVVGVLADRFGRKRMYGIELCILTFATVFVALTSEGALRSTNRLAWIVAWRFIMGLGIGGDYPLSAVITSEFAPRKHRARMLATVFFMQPIGALLANVVSVITVLILRERIAPDIMVTQCTGECAEAVDLMWRWIVGLGAVPPAFAILLRWWIPESPRYTLEVEMNPEQASQDVQEYYDVVMTPTPRPSEGLVEPSLHPRSANNEAMNHFSPSTEATLTFGEPMVLKDLQLTEPAIAIQGSQESRMVRKETWVEFLAGFRRYLFDEGNWTDLAGTAISWLVLDFAFYFLGVNSPKILSKLWGLGPMSSHPLHSMLLENGYRALIAVSTGAVVGGALFILLAESRWHIQFYGFAILAGLFVIVGVCFVTLVDTRYSSAVIVLYAVCNLFFNFGPNTSTFIIAAEVFPTKYRCTCHGLSAALGKFGSIVAQIFLTYAQFGGKGVNDVHSTWLGWVLLVFTIWMVAGAIVTLLWVPNPSNIWSQSRTLEDLSLGKHARKRYEKQEKEAWDAFVPGSPGPTPPLFAGTAIVSR